MKGITLCVDCAYYNMKKHKCMRGCKIDPDVSKGENPSFYVDCPLPDVEPVRRGRWVETEPDEDDRKIGIEFSIKCSLCHNENSHLDFNEDHEITGKTFWKSRFCPNCGARMGGGADNG